MQNNAKQWWNEEMGWNETTMKNHADYEIKKKHHDDMKKWAEHMGDKGYPHHQSTERTLHSPHKTSLQDHLSSNYRTVGTIQQHGPFASPPAQLPLWVPQFRPVVARSISCVWFDNMSLKQGFGFWNALRHIFLCRRRQCAKDCKRGFLGFLPKKESENPLATQITASVLPCFWLLQ